MIESLITLLILGIAAVIVAVYLLKFKPMQTTKVKDLYAEGLDLMITGRRKAAYKNFKDIIQKDSDSLYKKKLTIDLRKLGPKLGKNIKDCLEGANNYEWKINEDGTAKIRKYILLEDEYSIEKESIPGTQSEEINKGEIVASLKLELNQELKKEGIARDVLRTIQNKRKDLNFDISDEINVVIWGDKEVQNSIKQGY